MKIMTDTERQVFQADPLVLAYMGDAYFSLKVREFFINNTGFGAGVLHNKSKGYVSAVAQAQIWDKLKDTLDEIELDLGRRARNRHNNTMAKNSTHEQYKKATALECVLGYHYLTGNNERLEQIMNKVFQSTAEGMEKTAKTAKTAKVSLNKPND